MTMNRGRLKAASFFISNCTSACSVRAARALAGVEALHAHRPRRRAVLTRRFHAGLQPRGAEVEAWRRRNASVRDRARFAVAVRRADGMEGGAAIAAV